MSLLFSEANKNKCKPDGVGWVTFKAVIINVKTNEKEVFYETENTNSCLCLDIYHRK